MTKKLSNRMLLLLRYTCYEVMGAPDEMKWCDSEEVAVLEAELARRRAVVEAAKALWPSAGDDSEMVWFDAWKVKDLLAALEQSADSNAS